jgi:hypothetical protein
MAYDQVRFEREMSIMWAWTKPRLINGTISPFIAAFDPKLRGKAIGGLLLLVPAFVIFCTALIFCGTRRAIGR